MIKNFVLYAFIISILFSCTPMTNTDTSKIAHTVFFKLKHQLGSAEEREFFSAAEKLAVIPGVENFKVLKEISPKNKFEYGFSMEFASREIYNQYNNHPDHVAFVEQRWKKEVEEFMEIDYKVMQ